MGRESLIAFSALSVLALATAGLPPSLARFVGELLGAGKGGEALSLYRFTRRTEIGAAVLATATLAGVAALGSRPTGAWLLAGVGAAFAVAQSVPSSLLIGAQRWREASLAGLVCGVLSVPVTIAVLAAGGGVTGLFAVEAAVALADADLDVRARAADPAPPAAAERGAARRVPAVLRIAGTATLIGAIHFVVWRRSELLVMEQVSTDAQIAMYSIAFAVVQGLARLPDSIEAVTMPAVATLLGSGEEDRVRVGFWRSLRLLALLTPALVAGAAVTGPALIELAYGGEYQDAGPVLLVLLAPLLVAPLFSASEAVLFAMGKLWLIVLAGLAATVVDLGLAFALIPAFDAMGAASANTAAQLTAGVPVLLMMGRRMRPVELPPGPLLRGLALALLVGAAAWGARTALGGGAAGIAAAVVTGVVAFITAGSLLRPLAAGDGEWLARALGDRAPARVARRFGASGH